MQQAVLPRTGPRLRRAPAPTLAEELAALAGDLPEAAQRDLLRQARLRREYAQRADETAAAQRAASQAALARVPAAQQPPAPLDLLASLKKTTCTS